MSDERVTHQDVERYLEELPHSILDRLPSGGKKERAREHQREAAKLAHDIVETGSGC